MKLHISLFIVCIMSTFAGGERINLKSVRVSDTKRHYFVEFYSGGAAQGTKYKAVWYYSVTKSPEGKTIDVTAGKGTVKIELGEQYPLRDYYFALIRVSDGKIVGYEKRGTKSFEKAKEDGALKPE